ncbi:MAG: hypothetical protein CMF67_10925 [Magnetovibrio sp.]|nr:hypothetical protein [Magnetovibrio sp.]
MSITKQFIKYSSVAITSAIVDWIVYSTLVFFGGHYLVAQVVSRLAGGAYAFFTNKYWSFDVRSWGRVNVEGRRFLVLYVVSYGLSLGLLWFLGDIAGVNIFLAKLLADSSCLVFNFFIMRGYVFHPRSGIIGWLRAFMQNL